MIQRYEILQRELARRRPTSRLGFDDFAKDIGKHIDLFGRVVQGERGPGRARDAEALHERLAAVVAGADGDAFQVELRADVERRQRRVLDDERHHRRLVRRRADEADAGDFRQPLGAMFQQLLFVGGNSLRPISST